MHACVHGITMHAGTLEETLNAHPEPVINDALSSKTYSGFQLSTDTSMIIYYAHSNCPINA